MAALGALGRVAAYTPLPPPFSPADLSGLWAWWRADTLALSDGAAVATWPDSSGHGRDATQGTGALQPICKTAIRNGHRVVRFDGTQTYLNIPDLSSGWTSGGGTAFVVWAGDGSRGTYEVLRQPNSNTDSWWAYSGSAYPTLFRANRAEGYPAVQPGSGWHQNTVISGAAFAFYVDTILAAGAPSVDWRIPTTLTMGGAPDLSANRYLPGDIAEIILYNRAVTSTERGQVDAYLAAKWAL